MKKVGVRELKNRLSEYLRDVSAGETILITDHGHPIAELIKVRSNPQVHNCQIAPRFWDRATDGTMELPSSTDRSWTTPETQSFSLPPGTARRLPDEAWGGRRRFGPASTAKFDLSTAAAVAGIAFHSVGRQKIAIQLIGTILTRRSRLTAVNSRPLKR